MATFDLGRVTPLYKGDYSASTSYELNDVVLYNGNLYWHFQATATVGILPTDTTVWKLAFADEGVRAEIRGYADDAQVSKTAAAQSASQASASASNASASASQAASSAQAAGTSEGNASASASAAATSATNSAVSASQAASSAQTATDKATLASQKAQAATESASIADEAKTVAINNAHLSVTKADEARSSATQAANFATSAQEYDESAQQSAVNAQTAQGLAETAQTAAETAQGLAEDARDEAQSIVDEIGAKASQIDANTASIVTLEQDCYKPYAVDTASGAVASFMDGADDIPLKSLVVNIDPVQSGSGDPSPDNVRPISGWTQVGVEQSGVNVWDEEWEVGIFDTTTGINIAFSTQIRTKNNISVMPNQQYYASVPNGIWTMFLDKDGSPIDPPTGDAHAKAGKCIQIGGNYSKTFTPPNNCKYIKFYSQAVYGNTYNHDISINYPSTDHDYHPYTGRSITIQLGQTVYGGKLDVLSGELVVDKAMVDLGTLDWEYQPPYQRFRTAFSSAKQPTNQETAGNGISSIYTMDSMSRTRYSTYGIDGIIAIAAAGYDYLYAVNVAYTDAATFKSAMNGVQFVYELATPLIIQLTPNQVNSLLGVNNIWADSGDTEVEYRADTKLYIERLTEPDADMIADSNIVSGQYFMVGNSLYLATSNIASGGQVIVGTNCTHKSLSEALNEINQ